MPTFSGLHPAWQDSAEQRPERAGTGEDSRSVVRITETKRRRDRDFRGRQHASFQRKRVKDAGGTQARAASRMRKTKPPQKQPNQQIAPDVKLGKRVRIFAFTNLYGCVIGDDVKIGTFVEIQKGARIGNRCKISSHSFICEGVTLEDEVFIGHNVTFINDRIPRATDAGGQLQTEADWKCIPTLVKKGASIGSSATLLCGITVGEYAVVGAGSVVTKDVPPHSVVVGNPAKVLKMLPKQKQ